MARTYRLCLLNTRWPSASTLDSAYLSPSSSLHRASIYFYLLASPLTWEAQIICHSSFHPNGSPKSLLAATLQSSSFHYLPLSPLYDPRLHQTCLSGLLTSVWSCTASPLLSCQKSSLRSLAHLAHLARTSSIFFWLQNW